MTATTPRTTTLQTTSPPARWTVPSARLAVPVILAGLWYAVAPLTDLVPSPTAAVAELWDGFSTGWIYPDLRATAGAVGTGFLLGAVTAFPLGYLLGRVRTLQLIFEPLLAGTFAVPRVIVYPILLTVFGVGFQAETAMVAISAFFPIVMSTTASVRQVSPILIKLGRSTGAGPGRLAVKIVIPAAAPGIMVGVRIGFSIAVIAAVIAELFAAKDGLGLRISRAYGVLDLPRMYAVVLLVAVAALGGNTLLWWIERRLRSA
jgi:NitT/TauT family transport system permease protein